MKEQAYKRPSSPVDCAWCGETFECDNRRIKPGKNNYCSRPCQGKGAARTRIGDSFGFGYYSNSCRKTAKVKGMEFDLTAEYLKYLFDAQHGRCCVSGISMTMERDRKVLTNASVDRINNSVGYIKGNVRFVCVGINYMRNNATVKECDDFISLIRLPNNPLVAKPDKASAS